MRTLLLASAMVALSVPMAGSSQNLQPAANSAVGAWRKIDSPPLNHPATLTITAEKLVWVDGTNRLKADYGVTRDSMLFGIITKISGQTFVNGPGEDDPFAFHFRADSDELNVRGIKGVASANLARISGRHTKGTDERAETPTRKAGAKEFKK